MPGTPGRERAATQFFFLGFLLIGKGWNVIQEVFSVFSRNERAEYQRMAFSTEGQHSALKWCLEGLMVLQELLQACMESRQDFS